MKLERVDLKDIRQFVGEQSVLFSTDASHKVTLIHGPNTSGKTTLLNAIYWCFYGKFLAGFNEPERLKSEQFDGTQYYVEVRFEHRNKRYVARRTGVGSPSDATLQVLEQKASGQTLPHPQPELLIASILPEALAHFFFFAGEMMQKELSSGTYQGTATEAIRSVLGLKLAEQAIADLKDIRKRKQKELQNLSAGTDMARITGDLQAAEAFVDSRNAQLKQQRALVAQLETQKRELFDKLRGMESSSALQQRRDRTQEQLRQAGAALGRAIAAKQDLIASFGSALFLSDAAKQALTLIDEAVTKKRIPSPFDKAFVQDILNSQVCICHRPVIPGSDEYRAVASLVNSATDERAIRNALAVRAASAAISSTSANVARMFTRTLQQHQDAQSQVERAEQEEARIKDLLQRHEAQNVRELELQVDNVERTLRELVVNKQRVEGEIVSKGAEVESLRQQLDRVKAASPQVARARTAVELIEGLISRLETELQDVETRGIKRISEALNRVVSNSTRQKYTADVNSEYAIKLFRKDDLAGGSRPVLVLSSGERRLLDLCFVSALVSVCRERESEKGAILLPGAVAPLVVDAPFGELDPEYQALAAQTMMQLSDQLVLLLSKTHWTHEVDRTVRPSLGNEYMLVGYRAGPAREAAPVEIEINHRVYQQMVYDAGKDCTEIRRIGGSQ